MEKRTKQKPPKHPNNRSDITHQSGKRPQNARNNPHRATSGINGKGENQKIPPFLTPQQPQITIKITNPANSQPPQTPEKSTTYNFFSKKMKKNIDIQPILYYLS
jgi:hypothetical protein